MQAFLDEFGSSFGCGVRKGMSKLWSSSPCGCSSAVRESRSFLFFFPWAPNSWQTFEKILKKTKKNPASLQKLHRRLRTLRKEWRRRSSKASDVSAELRAEFHAVRKRIKEISRQQGRLNKARLQAKETARFRENPFNYGRQVFKPKNITKPDFDAEQATKYFSTVYSDLKRDFTYHQPQNLDDPPSTSFTNSTRPPSFADFSAVLRSRRNSSAPGPNGI